jgi:hypothetical protein
MADLTNYGLTGSFYLKNLDAKYLAPIKPYELEKEIDNIDNLSLNEMLDLIPKDWVNNKSTTYWETGRPISFSYKDGQTNAYVKRGEDEDVDELLAREETQKYVWQIATDDPIIFKAGGKVIANGREYFILKVIVQQSTGTYQNKFFAMDTSPENKRTQVMGLKTLVLI